MLAMDISVIQGDEVDALHRTMMLAGPKITDKRQVLAVRLVQDAVIDTQHATLQVQEGRGFIVQILAIMALPLQKTGGTIVGDVSMTSPKRQQLPCLGSPNKKSDVHRQGTTGY
jgi:hypothetical protein